MLLLLQSCHVRSVDVGFTSVCPLDRYIEQTNHFKVLVYLLSINYRSYPFTALVCTVCCKLDCSNFFFCIRITSKCSVKGILGIVLIFLTPFQTDSFLQTHWCIDFPWLHMLRTMLVFRDTVAFNIYTLFCTKNPSFIVLYIHFLTWRYLFYKKQCFVSMRDHTLLDRHIINPVYTHSMTTEEHMWYCKVECGERWFSKGQVVVV